ncbi:L-lactate dehydrogenase [Amycolatopsis sp. CA-230715]|uniref:L-lactate dehydrogenase n=1 Tax=Amycolatopsis sp. CA-230715 TaxID=2745196 RepID=UPI001C039566|nr:L-lactate dehydrogenase [Amycolatopsis sp. CA-230715]QWF77982.1 L-lactate dehydrogenase 2 [Amycolatopsis sp. CA-230715]
MVQLFPAHSAPRNTKVAIVGAGAVGATIAYACQIHGVAHTIALYDTNATKVRAQALDLAHGSMFTPTTEVVGSADVGVCADADVVVITAGAKQKPGQDRMALAGDNVALCRDLVPRLLAVAPEAILVPVTNPVDVVTRAVLTFSGLPARRVVGSGTVLDSSRLRMLISEHSGVGTPSVRAYIAGEHGDSAVPLWSGAFLGSVPISDWKTDGAPGFPDEIRTAIKHAVTNAAYEVIAGKGATSYAIGLAVAYVLDTILGDQRLILPVTSLVEDFHGITNVCLSLPRLLDRSGAGAVVPLPLAPDELDQLRASAEKIRALCHEFGL